MNLGATPRLGRTSIAFALVLLFVCPASPAEGSQDVKITMSYFRYCLEDVCTPDQFGYVRHRPPAPPGPALPSAADNPRGTIDVRPGDDIVWIYDDPLCDFNDGDGGGPSTINCPGHNVIFEDGSLTSPMIHARTSPRDSFSWTVPTTMTPGTTIRYYCEPNPGNYHYAAGMTGVLRVV